MTRASDRVTAMLPAVRRALGLREWSTTADVAAFLGAPVSDVRTALDVLCVYDEIERDEFSPGPTRYRFPPELFPENGRG